MRGRIDWWLASMQAACFAVAQTVFSATEVLRIAIDAHELWHVAPLLLLVLLSWMLSGLVLAAGAQWALTATSRRWWRLAAVVPAAALLHGPLNEFMVWGLLRSMQSHAAPLVVAPSLFLFWRAALGGTLFLAYCLMVQRSRERRRELAASTINRARLEASVREARAGTIQRSLDPALLEQSLATLRTAYGRDRADGEELLDALVEYLRRAMPSIRDGLPVHADSAVQVAWHQLRRKLEENRLRVKGSTESVKPIQGEKR
jgi:hypothetical protein